MAKRLTYDEVTSYVEVKSKSGCKLLSKEYTNNSTKMLFECKCGKKFQASWTTFKYKDKRRCDNCRKNVRTGKRTKTNEEFIGEVYELVGDEYTFLDEYINSRTKIKCRHNECKHEWSISPSNFLQGRRCPQCMRPNYNKDDSRFRQEVYNLVGNEYEFLEKYKGADIEIKCKHNVCGYEWHVRPGNFLFGKRCPQCMRPNYNRDTEHFKQEVDNLVGDEYNVLGEYINSATKIKMKHNKCGRIWSVTPNSFLRGTRCYYCYGNLQKTHEQFDNEVYNLVKDEYSVIGKYTNNKAKISIRHNMCGCIWQISPSNFLRGKRCPYCAESKGEQTIRKYLQDEHVEFQQEHTFESLLSDKGNPLRFDFAVFNYNNSLMFLIEYDGEFHYSKMYDTHDFESQKIHDKRKNQYCKDNNIPLLRIPYWDFDNIEQILEEWLDEYKLINC